LQLLLGGAVAGVPAVAAGRGMGLVAQMLGHLRAQGSLQNRLGQLLQQSVLANDVFRLLVVGEQLVYKSRIDCHRIFYSPLSDGHLHSPFYTLDIAQRLPQRRPSIILDDSETMEALSQSAARNPADRDRIKPLNP